MAHVVEIRNDENKLVERIPVTSIDAGYALIELAEGNGYDACLISDIDAEEMEIYRNEEAVK